MPETLVPGGPPLPQPAYPKPRDLGAHEFLKPINQEDKIKTIPGGWSAFLSHRETQHSLITLLDQEHLLVPLHPKESEWPGSSTPHP